MNQSEKENSDQQQCVSYIGLEFTLNKKDKTAEIHGKVSKEASIFIPRSITLNSEEYTIVSIGKNAFKNDYITKTIVFSDDSELQVIKNKSLRNSKIESLTIPSCVILESDWCHGTGKLNKITIIPKENQNLLYYDNSYLLGKTNPKSDAFDILHFARRDIEEANIPSFIKCISRYAFNQCFDLHKIEIPENSELETIRKCAFCLQRIQSLSIPSRVKLEDGWCAGTDSIKEIKIIQNDVQNIKLYQNKMIIGKSNFDSEIFDVIHFAPRNIKDVTIPKFIKKIAANSFDSCQYVSKIDISNDSELEIIDYLAFQGTSITSFSFPPKLTKICSCAFNYCSSLKYIDIPFNSELRIIEKNSFRYSLIKSVFLPSHLTKIDKDAFDDLIELVEIDENLKIELILDIIYSLTNYVMIMIPVKLMK